MKQEGHYKMLKKGFHKQKKKNEKRTFKKACGIITLGKVTVFLMKNLPLDSTNLHRSGNQVKAGEHSNAKYKRVYLPGCVEVCYEKALKEVEEQK